MTGHDAEAVAAIAAKHPNSFLAKLPDVVEIMEQYKVRMAEADKLVSTDIWAGVEMMALAVGHLNDAMGIGKDAALKVLQGIADLRDGKVQPWLNADEQFGGNKLDRPERERRTMAVAARIVIEVEDGLSIRDSARLVAKAIAKHRPKVTCGTVEGWGENIANLSYSPRFLRDLIDEMQPLSTEDLLDLVADQFTGAR